MRNEQTLVPELRFPEFSASGKWEEKTIGDIGSFYYGKSAPKWSLEENAPTPCVRYGELYTKFDTIIKETYSRTNIEPSKLKFSKGGEILVPRVGEKPEDFGKCCCFLPLKDIAIGEMISVFNTDENAVFYTHYFRRLYKSFAKVVEGQNVKNLYYVELEPLPICRPPTQAEQQKIADCLGSLDELIAAHSRKLTALQDHKKGLLQQLFPAECETTPKLRFPEFENAGEWEPTELGKLCSITTGRLDANAMVEGGKYRFYTCAREHYYIDDYAFDTDALLISGNGANVGYVHHYKGKFNAYQRTYVLDGFTENIIFLRYFLDRRLAKRIELEKKDGNTPYIVRGTLAEMEILVPGSSEQEQIADCLGSLDELIAAHSRKLTALQDHKRGLMQKLFPSETK